MKTNDSARASDRCEADVSMLSAFRDALSARGRFRATLTRVVPEHMPEALDLNEQYLRALERNAKEEAERLISRISALPRVVVSEEEFSNVVTDVGANDILSKYMTGSAYTQTIRMGLKGTGTATVAHTQASHAAWNEVGLANAPVYSGGRKTPSFSAPGSRTIQTSAAVNFTFTSPGTVAGCFINNGGSATIDDTTGVLVSAGDFGTSKTVGATDQLNVTYSLQLT